MIVVFQQTNSKGHALRPMRMENRRVAPPFTQAERIEGLMAYLDPEMPAQSGKFDMNALHAEALEMDRYMGVEEPDWLDPWEGESMWERDEVYFEGMDDSPNMYSPDDHWLPWARSIDEVRDIFGGTDFIIIHSFRA